MRSSLVVRASDCQCTSCNGPGFAPSIRRHSGIWGAADEAVLNIVRKNKKSPQKIRKKSLKILALYYRKSDWCISRKETARPRSQFLRKFMYRWAILNIPRNGLPMWLQQIRQDRWKYINCSQTHEFGNWETELNNSVLEITRPWSFFSGNTSIVPRHLFWILTGPSDFICSA